MGSLIKMLAELRAGRAGGQPANRTWGDLQNTSQRRLNSADVDRRGSRGGFMGAIQDVESFDPTSYMRSAAGSMYGDLSRDFNAAEGQRRAGLNRRGLLGSNIGGRAAEGRFNDALARTLAGLSMQGAGMRQDALSTGAGMRGSLFDSDTNQSNQFFDAVYGSAASSISQRFAAQQAAKERKNRLWGGLISAAGNIAGAKFMPGVG